MSSSNRCDKAGTGSEGERASNEETLYLLRSPANAARLLDAVRGLEAGGRDECELKASQD